MLQAQIIASKIEELKELWQLLADQLSALQRQKVLETRVEERLRLEQSIAELENERERVERQMLQLEVAAGDDGREALRDSERIQRVMDQLPGRAFEILEVIQAVGLKLKQMKQEGLRTECDRALLKGTEQFLAGVLDAEAFIRSAKQLNRTEQERDDLPNYERLAERLNKGQVILCLGQEFSSLLGARSPSTSLIRERLDGQEGGNRPLSEICEQKELT
ncbi:MAG: hypothetical protein D3906_14915, partial [Candidatus Electrothrix sp. AUS1_2]|nr:hypothetical protein [Candidatus Electrothrix sp. AUS1_2]